MKHSTIPAGNPRILLADSHSVSADSTSRSTPHTAQFESALSRALTAAALEIYLGRKPSPKELSGEMRSPGEKPCFPASSTDMSSTPTISSFASSAASANAPG